MELQNAAFGNESDMKYYKNPVLNYARSVYDQEADSTMAPQLDQSYPFGSLIFYLYNYALMLTLFLLAVYFPSMFSNFI